MFSFIIPTFNASATILGCVHSILDIKDIAFEIIIVDDGSSDETPSMIKKLESEYKNIKSFINQNRGVSYTRNFGVDKAKGKYILFVDSDDQIIASNIIALMKKIKNQELIIFGYEQKILSSKVSSTYFMEDSEYTLNDFLYLYWKFRESRIFNSPCNKIYLASIIKENNIYFDEGLELGEDLIFNLKYISNCATIEVSSLICYIYIVANKESLSQKFRLDYIQIQNHLITLEKEFLISRQQYNLENKTFFIHLTEQNFIYYFSKIVEIYSFFKARKLLKQMIIKYKKQLVEFDEFKTMQFKIFKWLASKENTTLIYIMFKCKEFIKKLIRSI